MLVYRLSKKKYSGILNGKGAAKSNNRWNSKGTEIIYTAESRALALAEISVHLSLSSIPGKYAMMEIEVPDALPIQGIEAKTLPRGWNAYPHLAKTQEIGDAFVHELEWAVLKVPSAVVHGDFNYLINPFHGDFGQIEIIAVVDFPIDGRLFR